MVGWIRQLLASISTRPALGDRGEIVAARHLRKSGHKILLHNYRTRGGEIDIIAREGNTLVFVEVKTRSSDEGPAPHNQVTRGKQHRLTLAAKAYLSHYDRRPTFRFDVVSIVWVDGREPAIEHLRTHSARPSRA